MEKHSALTTGNSKLGTQIAAWSLPPGIDQTCPGETEACRSVCYAKTGFFRMRSVQEAHRKNLELTHQPDFAEWMIAKIRSLGTPVLRIHVSGDFYSASYIDAWRQIVRASQRVTFFSYTRSWRKADLVSDLLRLANLPNMQLWWSLDRTDSSAPYVYGIRRAYLALDDEDAAAAPADCDLVFRDKVGTVMKKANTVFVCPPENGVKTKDKITCSKCGVCYSAKPPKWEQAIWGTINDNQLVSISAD